MAQAGNMGGQRQENMAWQLRTDEMEEKMTRLEWELGIAKAQEERAEAKASALELQVQSGKKEGGSKEIRHLVAVEAEKTQAIEQLISQEAQRSWEREEKLKKLQEEMIAGRTKSLEAGTKQVEEHKKVLQKLQVARGLIGVLQKEVHSQEDQIRELQEELESWQQRGIRAEDLAQEMRDKLMESHTQAAETDKVLLQEVEKMNIFRAGYEAVEKQRLSLEGELKTKERENDWLQTHLRSMEGEKDQLGQQAQSLKTLLEDSLAKEEGTRADSVQLQLEVQTMRQEIQGLETERRRLQEANDQMVKKIQDLGEGERLDERCVANLVEAGQKPQTLNTANIMRARLEALGIQLVEHMRAAKYEHQEQYREMEILKGSLKEAEALLEIIRSRPLKYLEPTKFPRDLGPGDPREEAGTGQSGKSTRKEKSAGENSVTL
ncbi:golgin subfamily A member 6-like protein 1 [Alligator sinensis]|uniref:Golgin subfamily A member 6-like protein 1 n=1 Tax=Alligator sinensis TaxID=38654 RepID=A0A3Q0H3C9_ALLSI|nr:golgin subfamily A member 6-like protein 1 [Alligator sinensis]